MTHTPTAMHTQPQWPALHNLVTVFFGQDMDLFGDSIEDVLDAFVAMSGRTEWDALQREIAGFTAAHPGTALEDAFAQHWHNDSSPARWDLSATAFIEQVQRRLVRALASGV